MMLRKRDYIKKRWLLYVSYLFIYILPLALILFKGFSIKEIDQKIAVNLGVMLAGIIYFAFVSKRFKTKITESEPGPRKTFLTGISAVIPLLIGGSVCYLIETFLNDTATTVWCIAGSIIIGIILQTIEATINKAFLFELEINKIAEKEVALDLKKKELLKMKEENRYD